MKIITTLTDDNDNVLAMIETLNGDMEAHEEKLYKIEQAIERELAITTE